MDKSPWGAANPHNRISKTETAMEEKAMLSGAIDITKSLFSFADSMVLKCAVELRIADIIHSHGRAISASEIASAIDSPSPNIGYLQRVMRMLVRMKIFTSTTRPESEEILYGLTPSSMILLHDGEFSLVPLLLMQTHPMLLSNWHYLSDCVREGGSGFKKAHGQEGFDMASTNPEVNKLFNDGFQSFTRIRAKAILSTYKNGFNGIESLVDVGGGTGHLVSEIVKMHPHIKGINFDLQHVVATAPNYNGITHVGGDMFEAIPAANAIIISHVFHNLGDEDCVKVLKNCKKAIPKESGKVIIVDIVVRQDANKVEDPSGNLDLALDLLMMVQCPGGKERTESEWKKILHQGGFQRYNIVDLPFIGSIIEVSPLNPFG